MPICVNKHAFIESIVEGITVFVIPFDGSIGKATDLPIVYAIDNMATFETHPVCASNSIFIPFMEKALL